MAGHWDGDWHLEVGRRDSLQVQEKQARVKKWRETQPSTNSLTSPRKISNAKPLDV